MLLDFPPGFGDCVTIRKSNRSPRWGANGYFRDLKNLCFVLLLICKILDLAPLASQACETVAARSVLKKNFSKGTKKGFWAY